MALDRNTDWKILKNQLIITGTWHSSFWHDPDNNGHYVLGRLCQKNVFPEKAVTHRLPMEELEREVAHHEG